MNIFFNTNHDLRSGWKFSAYVVIFIILWVAAGAMLTMIYSRVPLPEDQLTIISLNETALFISAVAAMLLTVRFVDHRRLEIFGVGFLPNYRRDLVFGLGMAAGMLAAVVAGCYAFGYVSIGWSAGQVPISSLLATMGVLLVAAATEELMFRGFPLQVLIDGVGTWPAVLVMSTLFGAVHMNNPNASLIGAANTALAGVLLSLAYVKTRSLWLPYGIHIGWNIGLGFVFGFPLSGVDLASLWTTGVAGNEKILGGGYGPEGGLLATFIFAASAVIIQKSKLK